ncbi:uncharacterized protein LOC127751363 [Frankliniella occidentalis]|uniref:DNA-directed DNA polymerase n=1 Tax=Frankliniella occidentalis TaxID=133901 RepID=A0A9C6X7Q5_FRAOC|nr:uncharacterized protein LOC127751363 [Frankliniella occidentalis]
MDGRDNWLEHKPNVLVAQQVCTECEHVKDLEHQCLNCGEREHIFDDLEETPGENVVSQFMTYLLSLCSEEKTQIQCFSHNGRAFDTIFILQECVKRKMKPEIILQGTKIICLKCENLIFKDSLLFMNQKLALLPRSFALTEHKKGYFPFKMNQRKWFSYIGPMPDKELYFTSGMKSEEKEEFDKWYNKQVENNYIFNFKHEILAYCSSDTDILRRSLQAYKESFMEIAGFDPLHHCLTLSSACMAMYRYKHLQPYTIGLMPKGGYRMAELQSKIALKWLSYEQSVLGDTAKIRTSENGREVRVMGKPVDGYTELLKVDGTTEKIIFQFHGCYFHMCPTCYPDAATRRSLMQKQGGDKYDKTMRITDMFKRNNYTVREMWECHFRHECEHDPKMREYFETNPPKETPVLNLRDTLCGGRTSALRTYKEANILKGERIKLLDVCSEYPFVNFKCAYVTGHPTVYLENDNAMPPIDQWNGAALVQILPPKNLFLPVLGIKCCSKLIFPLCRTCAESQNQGECSHEDPHDRMLTGSWCTIELQLAVKKGYKILKVYELLQYPGTRVYDPVTKTEGLFSSYVRENMALKYEASGWPSHVTTEEEKDKFIQEIFERDGIVIRKDKVEKNPGKRFIAKLVLNSFCKYPFYLDKK